MAWITLHTHTEADSLTVAHAYIDLRPRREPPARDNARTHAECTRIKVTNATNTLTHTTLESNEQTARRGKRQIQALQHTHTHTHTQAHAPAHVAE